MSRSTHSEELAVHSSKERRKDAMPPQSPARLVILLLLSIFIIEAVSHTMALFISPLSKLEEAILDSALLIAMLSPMLYFFMLRPLNQFIAQRKHVEENLRKEKDFSDTTIDSLPGTFYLFDDQGRFLRWNKNLESVSGYCAEEISKMHPQDLFMGEDRRIIGERIQEVFAKGQSTAEADLVSKDGHKTPFFFTGMRITIDQKQCLVGMGIDITERKCAEEKLKQTMADLSRSNAELEQFAYVASHHLQEPLRMMVSFSQLLEKRYKNKLDKDADEFINYIVDGAIRMHRLINDLLMYSQVDHSETFKPVNCETVLELALANLKVAIEQNGAVITHDPLPVVTADTSQMVRLFQNLLDNAIKFKKEAPRIHVSAELRGNEYVFSVRDNGIGIAPEFMKKLFIIFQRNNSKEEYPGTGIGLAICKKIVERQGGRIWVESEVAKGSTFYFTIPER